MISIRQFIPEIERVGVYLGRNTVQVAHIVREKVGDRVLSAKNFPIAPYYNKKGVVEATGNPLIDVLKKIQIWMESRVAPVYFSLPAPLSHTQTLSLEAIPRQTSAREAVVRLNIADPQDSKNPLFIRSQVLASLDDEAILLGSGLPRALVNMVKTASSAAGLVVEGLSTNQFDLFNYFHDELVRADQSGAAVFVMEDVWLLLIWDKAGRLRFTRSIWRHDKEDSESGHEAESFATETERSIRSHIQSCPDETVDELNIVIENEQDVSFQSELAARMSSEPKRVDCMDLNQTAYDSGVTKPGLSALAAAASL